MKRSLLVLILILCVVSLTQSQELSMDVQVKYPALATASESTLQKLENEIRDFYNNTPWTEDQFTTEERIECSMQINIKRDPSANTFIADIYISSGRPIYQSNYTSQLLNHVDKDVSFAYEEDRPILTNAANFTDNLSSILTFYAYVILGFDYDTFSPMGGDQYFKIAENIINNVPASTGDASWTANGSDRNRYWMIENLLDPRVKRFRQSAYDYHRNGLDKMHKDINVSKAVMLSAIKDVGRVSDTYRNAMVIQMFSNSKRQEILEVFKNSIKSEQRQVYNVMASIDPSQVDQLKALR